MQALQNVLIKGKPDAAFRSMLETEVDKACSGLFISNSYYSCIALAVFEVSSIEFIQQVLKLLPNEIIFSAHNTNNRLVFTLQVSSYELSPSVEFENESAVVESLDLVKSICDSVVIDNYNHSISLVFDILSFTNSNSIRRTKFLQMYFDSNIVSKEIVK